MFGHILFDQINLNSKINFTIGGFVKYILLLPFCLLVGCLEVTKTEQPPVACLMIASVPTLKVTIQGMQPDIRYQYWVDNKIIYDDCKRTSELTDFMMQSYQNPVRTKISVTDFLVNKTAQVKIYKMDPSCAAVSPAVYDELLNVREYQHTAGDPLCGYNYVDKYLNITF